MTADQRTFLDSASFAVAGASDNREKYGNMVFRALREYVDGERAVFPLNPRLAEVESVTAYQRVADLPQAVEALSIITPPAVTRQVVKEAIQSGVKRIWMQPGAEDDEAIDLAREAGLLVIAGGPCILVAIKTIG